MKAITISATVAMNNLALEKIKNKERVYNFSAGVPAIKNHPSIIDFVTQKTREGFVPYSPVEGMPGLRELAANWMNQHHQSQFTSDNVLVTSGGKFAIYTLLCALLDASACEKEEVLICAPYWVSYPGMVTLAGGVPKVVVAKTALKVTASELQQSITKQTKVLILNSANNPTGAVYSRAELEAILSVARNSGLMVVSDEVYSGLVYDENSFISCASFAEHRERVCVVQSCSKNFALSGWRVGFAFAPTSIIAQMASFQSQSLTSTSIPSQWAAMAALENAAEVTAYVYEEMLHRRNLFVKTFNSLFPSSAITAPASALYAFVPISSLYPYPAAIDSVTFCKQLLTLSNVALVPGKAFGVEGYVRFAFSCSDHDIIQGLKALKATPWP